MTGSRGKIGRRIRLKPKRERLEEESPGASTSMISRAIGSKAAREWMGDLAPRNFSARGARAQKADHLRVEGLPAVGDQDDLDVVDVEDRGRSQLAFQTPEHRALVNEATVRERSHPAGDLHRFSVLVVHLPPALEANRVPYSGLDAGLHRRRVPDGGDDRRLGADPEELPQDQI